MELSMANGENAEVYNEVEAFRNVDYYGLMALLAGRETAVAAAAASL
jgi:hypothetical protein